MREVTAHIINELKPYYRESEILGFIRIIIPHVLNLPYSNLLTKTNLLLNEEQRSSLSSIIERLKVYEPIQYIVGEEEFFGLPFMVDKNTLIPRPETEELVEQVIIDNQGKTPSILDIGTGSGCIAISLAKNFRNSRVSAWDFSQNALNIAKKNASLNHVDVTFLQVDILGDYPKDKRFSIIVSNPPYVLESEKKDMEQNVLGYEPHSALFVPDNNPLLFYERIANIAIELLTPNGMLYFEINRKKGIETMDMLCRKGFLGISLHKDISGNDRIVKAQMP